MTKSEFEGPPPARKSTISARIASVLAPRDVITRILVVVTDDEFDEMVAAIVCATENSDSNTFCDTVRDKRGKGVD